MKPLNLKYLCVAAATLLSSIPVVASDFTPAASVIGRAMAPSPLAEDLRRLTDDVGGRVTGTPAMARAVDWALTTFRAAGVAARTESYTMPLTWAEGTTRLEIQGPGQFPVTLVSEGWSAPTPPGGLGGRVASCRQWHRGRIRAPRAAHARRILLVDAPVIQTWDDLSDEYDRALPIKQRAVDAGARAVLWMAGGNGAFCTVTPTPSMGIVTAADGDRCARGCASTCPRGRSRQCAGARSSVAAQPRGRSSRGTQRRRRNPRQ